MEETELLKFQIREPGLKTIPASKHRRVPKVCAMQFGDDDKKDFRAGDMGRKKHVFFGGSSTVFWMIRRSVSMTCAGHQLDTRPCFLGEVMSHGTKPT